MERRDVRELIRRVRAALGAVRLPRGVRPPQQVTRLLVLFAALGAALVWARAALVPPTFGDLGHYRAAAMTEAMAPGIKYAGRFACTDCHGDVVEVQSVARHQTVACEACHGPAAAHVADPGAATPRVPRERDFCPRCHGYDPARPTGFPQIDPIAHNPMKACVSCHNPHEPAPPSPPSTCAACHAEIARVKMVSHHTALPCVRCHETEPAHMDTPRLSRPAKPAARAFCGSCHAPDARSEPEIRRVDMDAHGAPYVCWQCHFPHYPEVR